MNEFTDIIYSEVFSGVEQMCHLSGMNLFPREADCIVKIALPWYIFEKATAGDRIKQAHNILNEIVFKEINAEQQVLLDRNVNVSVKLYKIDTIVA